MKIEKLVWVVLYDETKTRSQGGGRYFIVREALCVLLTDRCLLPRVCACGWQRCVKDKILPVLRRQKAGRQRTCLVYGGRSLRICSQQHANAKIYNGPVCRDMPSLASHTFFASPFQRTFRNKWELWVNRKISQFSQELWVSDQKTTTTTTRTT